MVGRLRRGLPRTSVAANDSAILVAFVEPMFPGVDGVGRTTVVVAVVAVGFEPHPAMRIAPIQRHAPPRPTTLIIPSDAATRPSVPAAHAPTSADRAQSLGGGLRALGWSEACLPSPKRAFTLGEMSPRGGSAEPPSTMRPAGRIFAAQPSNPRPRHLGRHLIADRRGSADHPDWRNDRRRRPRPA